MASAVCCVASLTAAKNHLPVSRRSLPSSQRVERHFTEAHRFGRGASTRFFHVQSHMAQCRMSGFLRSTGMGIYRLSGLWHTGIALCRRPGRGVRSTETGGCPLSSHPALIVKIRPSNSFSKFPPRTTKVPSPCRPAQLQFTHAIDGRLVCGTPFPNKTTGR
jgi:hypothetical protein